MTRFRLIRPSFVVISLLFSATTLAQSALTIENARIKPIASGAFSSVMELTNSSNKAVFITSVSSPQFGHARLVSRDLTGNYQDLGGILIEAEEAQSMSSRGVQVLLAAPLQAVATTELTFKFADHSQQTILLSVAAAGQTSTPPSAVPGTAVVPTTLEKMKPKKQKRYRQKHNPTSR